MKLCAGGAPRVRGSPLRHPVLQGGHGRHEDRLRDGLRTLGTAHRGQAALRLQPVWRRLFQASEASQILDKECFGHFCKFGQ